MINEEKLKEQYIDHEIRIRIQEKISRDILSALRWLSGTITVAVLIPIALKYFNLM